MYNVNVLHVYKDFSCQFSPFKVTVQFEQCFRLMEHICVILCLNPINLYIAEKLIKFSK